jgi:DNA-binding PadR family transcriptional regulator
MVSQLRLLTLKVLGEGPASGYGIVKEIENRTGWKPSYGSVYPLLDDLKDEGIVTVSEDGRKKLYKLNDDADIEAKKRQLLEEMEENAKVMAVLTDEDMTQVIEVLRRMQEGTDPVAPLKPEILDFRNTVLQAALDGKAVTHTEDIKSILRTAQEEIQTL